jgi:hypothetical protein
VLQKLLIYKKYATQQARAEGNKTRKFDAVVFSCRGALGSLWHWSGKLVRKTTAKAEKDVWVDLFKRCDHNLEISESNAKPFGK